MLDPVSDVVCNVKDQPEPGFHPHLNWRAATELFEGRSWSFSEYFSFTTLRNPWELAVSYYSFFKPDIGGRYSFMPGYVSEQPMEFKTWLFEGKTWDIGRRQWRADIGGPGIAPFAFDDDGQQKLDEIYPVERMGELAADLSERLGSTLKPRHTNRSARDADYRTYFDAEAEGRVAVVFAKDIELGGYEF